MTITMEQIHDDLVCIRKELRGLRVLVKEEYELAEDVRMEVEQSRKRSKMISHEDMRTEFG